MSLLIISRSDDVGVDLVCGFLQTSYVRLNVDQKDSWSLLYSPESWTVEVNKTKLESKDSSFCWMWKCFLLPEDREGFERQEILYVVSELYEWHFRRGLAKGNPSYFHKRFGKIYYLEKASRYFQVPKTAVTYRSNEFLTDVSLVAKSLSSEPFDNGSVLYTTPIEVSDIDKEEFWFLQEKVEAEFDVTVFFAGIEMHVYARERRPGDSLDWRKDQHLDPTASRWKPFKLSNDHTFSLSSFKEELQLTWGRADFLLDAGRALWFLEYNANGQFGFLDPLGDNGLILSIAKYLENDHSEFIKT